jgi:electron transfer flavoprotein beta subunit
MRILVPIKRVPDPDTRIQLKADGSGIETDGVRFVVNPFDAIAMEEALRLREKDAGIEVVAVTCGAPDAAEQLRTCLAMGADRAILIPFAAPLDSLAVAKLLAALYRRERPDAVIMGKQAIDDDSNQTGQMLAGSGARARCGRETDAGVEVIEVALPAVVTTDLRLNEPRYVSLPGIMRAKKKPIEEVTPAALGVVAASRTTVVRMELPPRRKAGVRVGSVDELVARLRGEAKVI